MFDSNEAWSQSNGASSFYLKVTKDQVNLVLNLRVQLQKVIRSLGVWHIQNDPSLLVSTAKLDLQFCRG